MQPVLPKLTAYEKKLIYNYLRCIFSCLNLLLLSDHAIKIVWQIPGYCAETINRQKLSVKKYELSFHCVLHLYIPRHGFTHVL